MGIKTQTDTTSAVSPVAAGQAGAAKPALPFRVTRLDVALVLVMVIWGANFVVLKTALEALPPFVFNALRYCLASAVLGVVFKANGATLRLPRAHWLPLIGISVLNALFQIFFTYGLRGTTVANNALIITSVPVWVVIFNAIRSQERLSRPALTGVFLALAGVIIVVVSRYAGQLSFGAATLLGDGLSLLASWTWAINLLASRQPLQRAPILPATFWLTVWTAFWLSLLAVPDLLRMDWSTLTPRLLLAMCYSGILSTGLGSIIFNQGIKTLGTARTAVYTYLEPLVAAATAILFLGEPFTAALVIGAVMVILGLILVKKV